MPLAPRRRIVEVGAYLRSERRTLRQGFSALLVSTAAAFVAGVTLGSLSDNLGEFPGLLLLIPAAVSQRGAIFGAIGARLGTSTHAGLFRVDRERTGVLYQNVVVGVVLTLSLTLYLAALAWLFALAFGLPSISFLHYVTISVVGGVVSSAAILALTVWVAILCHRRGYDLDAVSTPVVTAGADMLTIPSLFLATFLTRVSWLNAAVAAVCIVVGIYAGVRGVVTDLPMVRRIVLETAPLALATPALGILAGLVIESRLAAFLVLPGLLVLVPPFISNAGALGGILSSRLSSKLMLGVITPRGRPEGPAVLDSALTLAIAVVVFSLVGALGLAFSELAGRAHPGAGVMIGGTLLAGVMATLVAIVVAYAVAVLTPRVGWDPDNHAIPVLTSVMDLVGVICLVLVLSLFGFGSGV